MKKWVFILFLVAVVSLFFAPAATAQCSICTSRTQQMGEKPASGLNAGILYLAFAPFLIVGYIGYRWWQKNKDNENL
jgi:hypothetical protein